MFGISGSVVYDILRKEAEGHLRDRSKVPTHQPHKTTAEVERLVVAARNKTRLGPQRLSIYYLIKYEGLALPAGTIRHILRRRRDDLDHGEP